jgi:hypothetical protein
MDKEMWHIQDIHVKCLRTEPDKPITEWQILNGSCLYEINSETESRMVVAREQG